MGLDYGSKAWLSLLSALTKLVCLLKCFEAIRFLKCIPNLSGFTMYSLQLYIDMHYTSEKKYNMTFFKITKNAKFSFLTSKKYLWY